MLTRLEVDGFKNLLSFEAEFGPYTCIAGPNGVGKSNVFDAIRFLSLLADHTIVEAALRVRGSQPQTSDLCDLFWTDGQKRLNEFRIAAEMLVSPEVTDDFGRVEEVTSTFLRYEVRIGYEESTKRLKTSRLVLLSESLTYITEAESPKHLRFPHGVAQFRERVVHNRRRSKDGFVSTRSEGGVTEINVHQDGGSRGIPQRAHAESAPRTIVGATNTTSTPTVLAARREMQSWRVLALEPSAMRCADKFHVDPHVDADGGHLAATLHRLASETDSVRAGSVFARIANRLGEFVPARHVRVDADETRQLFTLEVQEKSGAYLPARSLSDGTLRFLTLCVLSEDPEARGLLCMEEPENGIHPARLDSMVALLKSLAVDPERPASAENPMRQLVVATHSPYLVQLQDPNDLLFAYSVRLQMPNGRPANTIRCRPLSGTWRCNENERGVNVGSIISYLTAPYEAQLRFKDEVGLESW